VREEEALIVDTDTPEEQTLLTDVYADLKRKLVARGIPAHEVRFVHEAKTREARFALFQAANDGLGARGRRLHSETGNGGQCSRSAWPHCTT